MGYDPTFVVLSVLIAGLAGYTALELSDRATPAGSGADRIAWTSAAAAVMGGGIWAMHFVGMLAMRTPARIGYAIAPTLLSALVAVVATWAAFLWVRRPTAGIASLATGGLCMGLAIAGMHYIGMSAMRMPMSVRYDGGRVALSVLVAVVASTAGLWIALRRPGIGLRLLAAVVIGLAVSGMHYTGMWAARFSAPRDSAGMATAMPGGQTVAAAGGWMDHGTLVTWVVAVTGGILALALVASAASQARARRLLSTSDARFRVAAEAVGDIIWTSDPGGWMRGEQPDWSRFTGQTRAQYAGHGWRSAVSADDLEATTAAWAAASNRAEPLSLEHRVRRHDGVWRLCAVRAVPVRDDRGRIAEWVGVHTDITQRRGLEDDLREAKERAEAASRVKSEFIANMSHELRTPLTAIIGYSEMLEEDIADAAPAEQLLGDMRKIGGNARHLLGLINDILDLSKIEAGRTEIIIEAVDVAAFAGEVAAAVGGLVERRANRLKVIVPEGTGSIRTDATKLRQILLNLLGNAAKFTEGGTITLSAERTGGDDRIAFRVADTGIGMTAEQTERIFERFTQADASTTRRFGGTGLGLALTRAFATMLGGEIDVVSAPGVGTTFVVNLLTICPVQPEHPTDLPR